MQSSKNKSSNDSLIDQMLSQLSYAERMEFSRLLNEAMDPEILKCTLKALKSLAKANDVDITKIKQDLFSLRQALRSKGIDVAIINTKIEEEIASKQDAITIDLLSKYNKNKNNNQAKELSRTLEQNQFQKPKSLITDIKNITIKKIENETLPKLYEQWIAIKTAIANDTKDRNYMIRVLGAENPSITKLGYNEDPVRIKVNKGSSLTTEDKRYNTLTIDQYKNLSNSTIHLAKSKDKAIFNSDKTANVAVRQFLPTGKEYKEITLIKLTLEGLYNEIERKNGKLHNDLKYIQSIYDDIVENIPTILSVSPRDYSIHPSVGYSIREEKNAIKYNNIINCAQGSLGHVFLGQEKESAYEEQLLAGREQLRNSKIQMQGGQYSDCITMFKGYSTLFPLQFGTIQIAGSAEGINFKTFNELKKYAEPDLKEPDLKEPDLKEPDLKELNLDGKDNRLLRTYLYRVTLALKNQHSPELRTEKYLAPNSSQTKPNSSQTKPNSSQKKPLDNISNIGDDFNLPVGKKIENSSQTKPNSSQKKPLDNISNIGDDFNLPVGKKIKEEECKFSNIGDDFNLPVGKKIENSSQTKPNSSQKKPLDKKVDKNLNTNNSNAKGSSGKNIN